MSLGQFHLTEARIKNLFKSLNVQVKRSRGQNFLVDTRVVQSMVDALSLRSDDVVIEIGAGIGALTLPLAAQSLKGLIVYEIEPGLTVILRRRLEEFELVKKVEIIAGDFLEEKDLSMGVKIISSLPYSITSPVIHRLVNRFHQNWDSAVFLIQQEVLEKMMVGPPRAGYWYHYLGLYYRLKVVIPHVGPQSFWPMPRVDSSVFRLIRRSNVPAVAPEVWSNFLHRVFRHPRKQLGSYLDRRWLESAKVDFRWRAGQLTTSQLQELLQAQAPE